MIEVSKEKFYEVMMSRTQNVQPRSERDYTEWRNSRGEDNRD